MNRIAVMDVDVEDTCLAEDISEEVADLLNADYNSREAVDEAVHDYLKPDLVGVFGANRKKFDGETLFEVVEFVLTDGSSIVLAEDCDGELMLLTSTGSPSKYRH